MPQPKENFTIKDIYDLPEGSRAELIGGQIYYQAVPSRAHQEILMYVSKAIANYIDKNGGPCKVYPAPFAVFLNGDGTTYLEPDINVICDRNKLTDKGCNGAPDWIIEIVSPSSRSLDYYTKLSLYQAAGVREYWVVDPVKGVIMVYDLENEAPTAIYGFQDCIKVGIYESLYIDFSGLTI
ncbi:MAG: Uma2 family endonuclease [Hungatella sp.]|jgi:Uma2 family endonuclease|nr:Uma2 family endonuclease [Hungatella sp.]